MKSSGEYAPQPYTAAAHPNQPNLPVPDTYP
jgi:hypothetical protein